MEKHMISMRGMRLAMVGLFLTLSACAREYYVGPTGPDVAKVTVINDSPVPASVVFYKDATKCANELIVKDDSGISPGYSKDYNVSSATPATITLLTLTVNYPSVHSCRVTVSFQPAHGGMYQLIYGENTDKCGIAVMKRDPQTGKYWDEPTAIRRPLHVPFFASDGFCEPMTEADKARLGTSQ